MPGSELKVSEMVGSEVYLGDFDGEDDGPPVDMQEVFEAMKHVPLPDIVYPDHDDPISVDGSLMDSIPSAIPNKATHPRGDATTSPEVIRRKVADSLQTSRQPKRKGQGGRRVSKRAKVESRGIENLNKGSPTPATKGSTPGAAAKVAAEVAPDIFTGGLVAEAGPRPDFSLWTTEDDLLLCGAMEAGAAMEALAKGALRFSRRFTMRELRERWRALLYNPEVSVEAASRMAEAKFANSLSKRKEGREQKSVDERTRKRRPMSIRTLYYKKRRGLITEDVVTDKVNGAVEHGTGVPTPVNVVGNEDLMDTGLGPVPLTSGPLEIGCLSPRPETSLDLVEDGEFSQMFTLLALGGVEAVVGDVSIIPAFDSELERDDVGFIEHQREDGVPPPGVLVVSNDIGAYAENGQVSLCSPPLDMPVAAEGAQSDNAQGKELEVRLETVNSRQILEEGIIDDNQTDGELEVGQELSTQCRLEARSNADSPGPRSSNTNESPDGQTIKCVPQIHHGQNAQTESRRGFENPLSSEGIESICESAAKDAPAGVVGQSEGFKGGEKVNGAENIIEKLDEHSHVGSAVSTDGETKLAPVDIEIHCHPAVSNIDAVKSKIDGNQDTKLSTDTETADSICIKCPGSRSSELGGDTCDTQEQEKQACSVVTPSTPTCPGETCCYTLDCPYQEGNRAVRHCEAATCVVEHFVCTFNTEDAHVPSLEDSLIPCLSPRSLLEEEAVRLGFERTIFARRDGSDHNHNDAADEFPNCSSQQGVPVTRMGGEDNDGVVDLVNNPARAVSHLDKSGDKPVSSADFESMCAVKEEVQGSICGGQLEGSLMSTDPVTTSGQVGCSLTTPVTKKMEQSIIPPVHVAEGEVGECHVSSKDQNGDTLPKVEISNGTPLVEPCGEAHELGQEQAEEELESDSEFARFSDLEAMILDMDLDPADDDISARAESRRLYRRYGKVIVRAEQSVGAAVQRELNMRGAFAVFYGLHLKYYMTKTEVLIGRATSDNIVDVDLGREGPANKVSRQQAFIKLKDDGIFYLRNLGRRCLTVNNKAVETGQRAILGSECLIEVGRMRLIFETNKKLVREHALRRSQQQLP